MLKFIPVTPLSLLPSPLCRSSPPVHDGVSEFWLDTQRTTLEPVAYRFLLPYGIINLSAIGGYPRCCECLDLLRNEGVQA